MLFFVKEGCPNCKGTISDERLKKGLVCEKCLEKEPEKADFASTCKFLKQKGLLKSLEKFCEVERKVKSFKKIFKEIVKSPPSSLQISWAKRLFLGESFAIIAPTGTGKSTFGLISALLTEKKALIIVPTKVLVEQVEQKLLSFIESSSKASLKNKKILAYKGKKSEKKSLEEGNFDVFVCTSSFLHKNFELLRAQDFSLIFIDDVDSFLKSGKNVDNLFLLLGFTEEEIKLALQRKKDKEDYLELDKIKEKHKNSLKQLIISSATLKPRTNRVLLFQNLLGFEITRFTSSLRKVVDTYLPVKDASLEKLFELASQIVKKLGEGGLIFVEESYGRKTVEELTSYLRNQDIKAVSYLEVKEQELLYLLEQGEVEVAVGLCHLGNPLVRGVDLPEVLKYALFLGVPKHLFPLSKEEEKFSLSLSPQNLHSLLLSLMPVLEDEEKLTAISYVSYLRKYLTLSEERLKEYESIYKKAIEIKNFLEERLNNPEFMKRLQANEEVFLQVGEDGTYYIVVGNANAYLQASGRVSRLTTKGLLPGLSLILADDLKALNSLKKRLRFYIGEEHELKEVNLKEIETIYQKILKERQSLKKEKRDFKNYLLIVESPHKAKTIASFFGKPSVRRIKHVWVYEIPMEDTLLSVCASLGHIFNLSRKEGIFGVISENSHFYPVFGSIKLNRKTGEQFVDREEVKNWEEVYDKGEIIEALRYLAFCADKAFVASDPDAEGEKIAYDLFINIRPFQPRIKRLEFHEVTQRALKEALKSPQDVNLYRVKAQLARRVADRWVGFSLSQELWKVFNKKHLSAGRVQTPVLGWIIERAEKAKESKYRISFQIQEIRFSLEFEEKELAERVKEELPGLKIKLLEEKEDEIAPPPPYTTDTVLEDAFHFFRFTTPQTMELLQELFELGLITYHRTDSTRISEVGRYQVARPYIIEHLGEEFFYPREWKAEGAHEGIRPTKPWDLKELKLRVAHGLITLRKPQLSFKLYDIIFRRFMASQTRKTKVKKGIFSFELPSYSWQEELILEVINPGFEKFWKSFEIFSQKEQFTPQNIELARVPKVFLFNQGTLIQEMKKRGLGRPSTYAEIISTLLHRRYVYELKTGGLVPTSLGKKVYQFLKENFKDYVSEEFTRELEMFMDEVEEKGQDWQGICLKLLPLLKRLGIINQSNCKSH